MRLSEFENKPIKFEDLSPHNQKIFLEDPTMITLLSELVESGKVITYLSDLSKKVNRNSEESVKEFMDVCERSLRNYR